MITLANISLETQPGKVWGQFKRDNAVSLITIFLQHNGELGSSSKCKIEAFYMAQLELVFHPVNIRDGTIQKKWFAVILLEKGQ